MTSGKPNYRENTNNNHNNNGSFESEKSAVLINNKPLPQTKVNVTSDTDDQTDLLPLEAPKTCESVEDVCITKDDDDDEQCEIECELMKKKWWRSRMQIFLNFKDSNLLIYNFQFSFLISVLDSTDINLVSFFRFAASQTEVISQSAYLNAEEIITPKQKNQSTSPNLPLNETIINEEEVRRAPR